MSFLEIFQPGLKHLREERDRQKIVVHPAKHGADGPLGIDLNSGTATFLMPAPAAEPLPGSRGDKDEESHPLVDPA